MIWGFWRESEPVIRHYLLYHGDGAQLCYGAYDTHSKKFVTQERVMKTTAEPSVTNPVDPMAFKIRFPKDIKTLSNMEETREAFDYYGNLKTSISPVFTWANFEKDIFFVHCSDNRQSGSRGLGYFLYLLRNVNPTDHIDSHWCRRITQLAMWSRCGLSYLPMLRNMDLSRELPALKTVSILYYEPRKRHSPRGLWKISGTGYIYIHNNPIEYRQMFYKMAYGVPATNASTLSSHEDAGEFARLLKTMFDRNGLKVDINIVSNTNDSIIGLNALLRCHISHALAIHVIKDSHA